MWQMEYIGRVPSSCDLFEKFALFFFFFFFFNIFFSSICLAGQKMRRKNAYWVYNNIFLLNGKLDFCLLIKHCDLVEPICDGHLSNPLSLSLSLTCNDASFIYFYL